MPRRVYKIFMRTKMTVLRITDSALFARVAVGFGIELVCPP